MSRRRYYLPVLAFLLVVLAIESGWMYWNYRQPHENGYDPIIVAAARENGIDPFLVRAVVWRESHFNPNMYGRAQEHGLMQVTPLVGEMWAKAHKITNYGDDDLYDPTVNIRAGTWYLSRAMKRWTQTDDPPTFALADYNAGHSNALKWVDPNDPANHLAFLERMTFPSTHKYVEDILAKRAEYRIKLATNRYYREFAPSVTEAP